MYKDSRRNCATATTSSRSCPTSQTVISSSCQITSQLYNQYSYSILIFWTLGPIIKASAEADVMTDSYHSTSTQLSKCMYRNLTYMQSKCNFFFFFFLFLLFPSPTQIFFFCTLTYKICKTGLVESKLWKKSTVKQIR